MGAFWPGLSVDIGRSNVYGLKRIKEACHSAPSPKTSRGLSETTNLLLNAIGPLRPARCFCSARSRCKETRTQVSRIAHRTPPTATRRCPVPSTRSRLRYRAPGLDQEGNVEGRAAIQRGANLRRQHSGVNQGYRPSYTPWEQVTLESKAALRHAQTWRRAWFCPCPDLSTALGWKRALLLSGSAGRRRRQRDGGARRRRHWVMGFYR